MAPSAMKYDADEASPSMWYAPGERYAWPPAMVKRCQPSRATSTPKRRIRFNVISMYGFEMSSPCTSTITGSPLGPASSGAAMSTAVRNWLDTVPFTRTGRRASGLPRPMRSGG